MAKTSVDRKYIRDSIENIQTNEITISEDKLRIKLEKQIKRVRRGSGVLGYISVAITCVGVLVSTDFKEVYGITPDMWKTVFFLAAVVFVGLSFFHVFYALFFRASVDSIVKDIKTSDQADKALDFLEWLKNFIEDKFNGEKAKEEEEK